MKKALPTLYHNKTFLPGIILLLAVCFLGCASAVAQNNNIDYRILRAISHSRTEAKNHFFKDVSDATSYVNYSLPAVLLITAMIRHNKAGKQKALTILESQLLTAACTWGIKHVFDRPRPSENDPSFVPVVYELSASFPSGHTGESFATATAISLAYPKWYVIIPAYAWAATVGYSRLYLGVHYPSDVLGGAVLGSGCAFLTYKINQWWQRKQLKKKGQVQKP
ncbi:MAG: phosphatase PAP2 family protein [Bacteroidota bacterium]|nr:phosphatase PAP2 family protein [Bacteroidota bacterium]